MVQTLNIIACCDNQMGIGKDNKLPWSIPSEMELFKEKTIGKGNNCVIMGKKTYLSIPKKYRPLSERYNCVISRNDELIGNEINCKVLRHLNEDIISLLTYTSYDTYWIIGGSSIYYEIMTHYLYLVDEIHVSILEDNYACDKFFPPINHPQFILKDKKQNEKDKYTHYIYKKKNR